MTNIDKMLSDHSVVDVSSETITALIHEVRRLRDLQAAASESIWGHYLSAIKNKKILCFLLNGVKLQGAIVDTDPDCFVLVQEGKAMLVNRAAVSTVLED